MTWDGQPLHRNLGGDGEEPKIPSGGWREGLRGTPRPSQPDPMPADPFGGMTAPAVANVEMIRAHIEAGLTEQQALFYQACLIQVGVAIQQGGLLDRWPQSPEET